MTLDVGPVSRPSAAAWIGWAQEVCAELRNEPSSTVVSGVGVLDDVDQYLEWWTPQTKVTGEIFHWHAEIDPEELEYLVQAFFNLDKRLVGEGRRGGRSGPPAEARVFYVVLVRAMLHALEGESAGRAAFVDRLRFLWPTAIAAN